MFLDYFSQIYDNCILGGYVFYFVVVIKVFQIQLVFNFVCVINIWLVVKNMGYDFVDKFMGVGLLFVWIYKFKDIQYILDYICNGYLGLVFKFGFGVEIEEVY